MITTTYSLSNKIFEKEHEILYFERLEDNEWNTINHFDQIYYLNELINTNKSFVIIYPLQTKIEKNVKNFILMKLKYIDTKKINIFN